MKNKKTFLIIGFIILFLFTMRLILLKKPSAEITYAVKKENLVDVIQLSGTFNKTVSEEQKALAYLNYQNAINALKIAQQNKQVADATMWTKQQIVLNSQNNVDYKNDNVINSSTKKDYTDLEKQSVDASLVQAQKDFLMTEQKYKEADVAIAASQAQVNLAKLDYDDAQLNELVITADVNEIYMSRLSVGQKVKIVFDSLRETPLAGSVESVDKVGAVVGGIVTYETKISIKNIPTQIKPNMTALITIETLRRNNVISIPNSAIIIKDGQTYIQKANDKNKSLIKVKLGTKGIVKTEITDGLTSGDIIIANPKFKL